MVVATSRMFSVDDLLACHPDALLPDLSNVNQVVETLDRL